MSTDATKLILARVSDRAELDHVLSKIAGYNGIENLNRVEVTSDSIKVAYGENLPLEMAPPVDHGSGHIDIMESIQYPRSKVVRLNYYAENDPTGGHIREIYNDIMTAFDSIESSIPLEHDERSKTLMDTTKVDPADNEEFKF